MSAHQMAERISIIIDAHCDILYDASRYSFSLADDLEPGDYPGPCVGLYSVPKWRRAGVRVVFCAIFTAPFGLDMQPLAADQHTTLHRALRMLAIMHRDVRRHPLEMLLVRGPSDIDEAVETNRLGIVLALEGADPLGIDIDLLDVFHALGVRVVGLTWNNRNPFADGRLAGDHPGGLSGLGRSLLARMEELGMLLDLAHLAPQGMDEVFAHSKGPVILSHTRPRGGTVPDRHLEEIARRGGVVGVMLYGMASIAEVVDHIEHLASLIGDHHIGLGSDLWQAERVPQDLPHIGHLPRLAEALIDRGWSHDAVARFMGGNWHRVLRAILKDHDVAQTESQVG